MKLYKIQAPIGTTMIPKKVMTEKDIREFIPQLIQDPDMLETWKEKAAKDEIEDLITWLLQAGYKIEQK